MGLIEEAKEFMVHDIAPTLNPTVQGLFQVRLNGLYRRHAELCVNLVNERCEVVKGFGVAAVPVGGAVIIDQFSSLLHLVEGTPPVDAFFQAWLIGVNESHTEAELSLRLVDSDRKELKNFGSTMRGVGGTITLQGMDITVNILRGEH